MQIKFSEDGKNQEGIAFAKAVIQGLMDIKEGNTMTLDDTKKRLLVDKKKKFTMNKFM